MPDNRNLAVTAMLSLLNNKVHCLVTNLLTMKKVIPHQVLSGEISEGHRRAERQCSQQDDLHTGLLTQPGLVDSTIVLGGIYLSLKTAQASHSGHHRLQLVSTWAVWEE